MNTDAGITKTDSKQQIGFSAASKISLPVLFNQGPQHPKTNLKNQEIKPPPSLCFNQSTFPCPTPPGSLITFPERYI